LQVRLQPFQGSGQIENDFNAGEIVTADSPKRFYSAQTANGIPIKVVTLVSCGPRGEKKVMFAINQNRPAGHVHQVRRRFDRVDGIWWRVEQLDLARSGW
jgi:hypothetical protein